jgi:hypothetical protein
MDIGAAKGAFKNALKKREWRLRIHPPAGWPNDLASVEVRVNGKKIGAPVHRLNRDAAAMPFGDASGAPDAAVFEISLPSTSVSQSQSVEIYFR